MKKILFLFVFLSMSLLTFSQTSETAAANDWNTLRKPGFYESHSSNVTNVPANNDWYWGINIAHSTNNKATNSPYHFGAQILFPIKGNSSSSPEMFIRSMNKFGEGAWAKVLHSMGNHIIKGKLTVEEVEIRIISGADFVFDPNYNLTPLPEVEQFVKENRHLPEIPSEKQMIEEGVNVNELQIKLLQKIEELTLYTIELSKEVQGLKKENREIRTQLEKK